MVHPDLLPSAEQLHDLDSFFSPQAAAIEDELDSFLAQLLDSEDDSPSEDQSK